MMYYRSKKSAAGPSLTATRALCAVALAGYPVGCLLLLLRSGTSEPALSLTVAGLGLILLSIVAVAPVVGSRYQRITAEQASELDEFELKLRQYALGKAYQVFTAGVLAGIVYFAIAADAGAWVPRSYEEFNALFWGVFLYACLLPATLLVWSSYGRLVGATDEGVAA